MTITGTIRKYRQYEIMKTTKGWRVIKLDLIFSNLQDAMDSIDNYEDAKQRNL